MKPESYAAAQDYRGPERRQRKVYVTRNTEYHLIERRCVAVRDRRTGEFLNGHLAIDRVVEGGLKFCAAGGVVPNTGEPRPGESLYFSCLADESRDLVTSPIERVERPRKDEAIEVGSRAARHPERSKAQTL